MNNDVDDHLSQPPGILYDDSKALREVVPIDIIFPLFFFVISILLISFCLIKIFRCAFDAY